MKTLILSTLLALAVLPVSAGAVSLYGDTSVKADVQAGATTSVEVGAGGSTNVETPSGVTVDVDRSDDGRAVVTIMHKDGEEAVAEHTKAAIESVVKAHGNVRAVDLDADGSVDVAYVHHGWLFGFIPVTVTSHTTVDAVASGDAKVQVRLPWWRVLVSGLSDIETEAESALNADATIMANAQVNANESARVQLVEAIITSLTKVDAAVKASYDVKANVK